jgi:RsiW-degrading membrane proteinase PrsW (M82 family)
MNKYIIISLASLIALLPAIFWFYIYRWLDKKDPEPKKAMIMSGVLGVVATLPVFGLQLVFDNFPELNFMKVVQASINNPVTFSIFFLIFVAVLEELVKAISTIIATEKYRTEFNQVVDGIVYAASVALGFSFAENIYYFYIAVQALGFGTDFLAVYSIRSLGTMLGHTIFTGIFGFYYAKAYLAKYVETAVNKKRAWHGLHKNLKHALKFKATRNILFTKNHHSYEYDHPGIIILEGYFIAVLLHFIYNFLIKIELFGRSWTFLIVPFLFIATWYVWHAFFVPLYTKVFKVSTTKDTSALLKLQK